MIRRLLIAFLAIVAAIISFVFDDPTSAREVRPEPVVSLGAFGAAH